MQNGVLVISTTDTLKKLGKERGQTEPGLVAFYDIRPGNGAVYSFNPGARTGHKAFRINPVGILLFSAYYLMLSV